MLTCTVAQASARLIVKARDQLEVRKGPLWASVCHHIQMSKPFTTAADTLRPCTQHTFLLLHHQDERQHLSYAQFKAYMHMLIAVQREGQYQLNHCSYVHLLFTHAIHNNRALLRCDTVGVCTSEVVLHRTDWRAVNHLLNRHGRLLLLQLLLLALLLCASTCRKRCVCLCAATWH
jgi:hypothetical protein